RAARAIRVSAGGPAGLDRVDGLLRRLAADPGDDALPERIRAHGTRHEVGAVEAERGVGVLQNLDRLLEQLARGVVGVEALVGRDHTAERYPVVRPGVAREVRTHRLDLLGVTARARARPATGHRPRTVDGRRPQQEPKHVTAERAHVALVTVGVPEGLIDRGLVVQRAPAVEDREAGRLEGLADLRR